MNQFIINADDFGKNEQINNAIIAAMQQNLCSDATMLVNFKDAEHATELVNAQDRANDIGIHFNLTDGFPLSDAIKKERRFCNEHGAFIYRRESRLFSLSISERDAIIKELSSQIKRCRDLGINISHADSHNHIHEEPALLDIFIKLSLQERIPFFRITRNIGKTSILNTIYRSFCNWKLDKNKLRGTRYFGSTDDYMHSKNTYKANTVIELMIHPGDVEEDEIYDHYLQSYLNDDLKKILDGNELISYRKLFSR